MHTEESLSQNTQQALSFLREWSDRKTLFNLELIFSVAVIEEGEYSDFLQSAYEFDLSGLFKDRLYVFAVDGAGGEYALWLSPDEKIEHPVIFLDHSGVEHEYLAPSLAHFVHSLTEADKIEEFVDYDDLIYDFEDLYGKRLGRKAIKEQLAGEVAAFEDKAKIVIADQKSTSTATDHSDFLSRVQTEADRLSQVLVSLSDGESVALTVEDEQAFFSTLLTQLESSYEQIKQGATVVWHLEFVTALENMRYMSEHGYRSFMPDAQTLSSWRADVVPLYQETLELDDPDPSELAEAIDELNSTFDELLKRSEKR